MASGPGAGVVFPTTGRELPRTLAGASGCGITSGPVAATARMAPIDGGFFDRSLDPSTTGMNPKGARGLRIRRQTYGCPLICLREGVATPLPVQIQAVTATAGTLPGGRQPRGARVSSSR